MTTPKVPKFVVHTEPLRALLRAKGMSYSELGRQYTARFGEGIDREATVVKLLSINLLDLRWADELSITIGTHPLLVWGDEWDEPIDVGSRASIRDLSLAVA